ncbi:MAG TPA: hypothetical protein PLW14_03900 [Chlorobiota bacterium]|nr:hypothetical protein [Chlorobiota bacterium]
MLHVVNIVVRSAYIIVGISVLAGVPALESPLREALGTVAVLYGVFRLVTYFNARRRYQHDNETTDQ